MMTVDDPREALKISQAQKKEAEDLRDYAEKLMRSLKRIQKKNGFAAGMEAAYQGRW